MKSSCGQTKPLSERYTGVEILNLPHTFNKVEVEVLVSRFAEISGSGKVNNDARKGGTCATFKFETAEEAATVKDSLNRTKFGGKTFTVAYDPHTQVAPTSRELITAFRFHEENSLLASSSRSSFARDKAKDAFRRLSITSPSKREDNYQRDKPAEESNHDGQWIAIKRIQRSVRRSGIIGNVKNLGAIEVSKFEEDSSTWDGCGFSRRTVFVKFSSNHVGKAAVRYLNDTGLKRHPKSPSAKNLATSLCDGVFEFRIYIDLDFLIVLHMEVKTSQPVLWRPISAYLI